MVGRYLVIYASDADEMGNFARTITTQAQATLGLDLVFDAGDVVILADLALRAVELPKGEGVLLGDIFPNGGVNRLSRLPPEDGEVIARSGGQTLMSSYWGAYVGVLHTTSEHGHRALHVLRAPSGEVPCYHIDVAKPQNLRLFFSHLDLVADLGLLRTTIDFEAIHQHLVYPVSRPEETCLKGVREVLPGTRISRSRGRWETDLLWSPWTSAARDQQYTRRADAVEATRETALACAKSWASTSSRPLLELSGGLDSSIVGACMTAVGMKPECVTLVTPDPGADERRYAAALADHIGAPLHVAPLAVRDIVVGRLTKLRYPRPVGHYLSRVVDDHFGRLGKDLGTDAFFGGSGGDYVFGYLGTSAPAADVLLTHGFGPVFFRTVADLATLHRSTIWNAARLAWIKSRSSTMFDQRPDVSFLTPDTSPNRLPLHWWLTPAADALPSKHAQTLAMAGGQESNDARERSLIAPCRQLLLSQPLVEVGMKTPAWMSIRSGRNRSVARDALADLLPSLVLARQTKGNFTVFNNAVYLQNAAQIRELLLEGELARAGLLDLAAILAHFEGKIARTDASFNRLIDLAYVEIWTRSWLS